MRVDAKELVAGKLHQEQREHGAGRKAGGGQYQHLAHDQGHNVAAHCSERDANAYFTSAPSDDIGQYTVEADHGQQGREAAKHRGKAGDQPFGAQ
jgi:hypothetical protein